MDVARLQELIQRLSALAPLTIEGATALLGVQRYNEIQGSPVNTEWQLTSTDLVAGGRAGISAGIVYVEIRPAPALRFSFEDLAAVMMDAPYLMKPSRAHGGYESEQDVIVANYHIFRVKAGEMKVRIPASATKGISQTTLAIQDGHAVARGTTPSPNLLQGIVISTDNIDSRWRGPTRTLRSVRSPPDKRKR